VVVPWNIVSYNVFGGEGKGPDIFGTEPWTFYLRNLLLNFNIWSVLAMATGPLLILQAAFRSHKTSKETLLRSVTFVLPFYLWLAIFTLQPHKEERFMYPAYPFLALNAAISAHLLLSYIGSSDPKEIMGRVPLKLKMFVVVGFFLLAASLGLSRITGVVTAYNAPLRIFEVLEQPGVANPGDYVCMGKEWYRFPSSFFLPKGLRVKFVKSEFRGLLPGEFAEGGSGLDLFPGTWVIPPGMNDRNQEDLNKYVSLAGIPSISRSLDNC
jgi:alpha-1,2-mannosyltransferase